MSIKVCHVTSVHKRYDTRIFLKECTSLAEAGYDVTLLVADEKPKERLNDVDIIPVPGTPKSRILRILKSGNMMLRSALEINAEIYHLHDPELLPLAKKLKKNGKKVIFDSHEDLIGNILGKKWIPKLLRPTVAFLYRCYSKNMLKKLDYLIAVSPNLGDKLKKINSNVKVVTNYPIVKLENRPSQIQKNNAFCFAGGITEQWNHQTILSALEDMETRYHLMGSIAPEYLSKLKEYNSWEKIIFHGRLSQEEVGPILSSCAAGLAILDYSDNVSGKEGTLGNTKFFEYMQAGIPVICTDFVLWKEVVEKWDCGICIPPRDTSALKKAMQFILDNPDKAEEMGKNGREAVEKEYNWDVVKRELLKAYQILRNSNGEKTVF